MFNLTALKLRLHELETRFRGQSKHYKAFVFLGVYVVISLLFGNWLHGLICLGVILIHLSTSAPHPTIFLPNVMTEISMANDSLAIHGVHINRKKLNRVVIDEIEAATSNAVATGNLLSFAPAERVGLLHFAFNKGGKLIYHFPCDQIEDLKQFFRVHLPRVDVIT